MAGSLLEAVGGRAGVAALIEEFYRGVEADLRIRPVYPDDLGPGKAKLALFFEQWLGGQAVYSERYGHPRLRRRHFPFVIEERHAGIWLRHMQEALAARDVPPDAARAIIERLAPLARHMVNAGEDVPREPLEDAFLE